MEPFEVVHRFRTLSNRGFITPLACRMCSHDLTIKLGENDEPTTVCFTCGSRTSISAYSLVQMSKAIANYERGRNV